MKTLRYNIWVIAGLGALSSAFGLVYSQLLVKTLVSFISNFLLAQTLTLGFFIGFMGLGTYLADRVADKNLTRRLAQLQLGIAFCGMTLVLYVFSLYFINKFYLVEISDYRDRQEIFDSILSVAILSQLISASVGLFAGLELGLLVRLGRKVGGELGASRVLAGSYAGTLAATMVFIWAMPVFAPLSISQILACVNVLFSLLFAWFFLRPYPRDMLIQAVGAMVISGFIYLTTSHLEQLEQIQLKAREVQGLQVFSVFDILPLMKEIYHKRPQIFRHNTGYQNADFIFQADGGFRFLLDNHPQDERIWVDNYHEGLIDVPIQFYNEVPARTLVLGGGDGIAMGSLLKYGEPIKHIDLVELDPWMIHMAKTNSFFTDLNLRSYWDPKVSIINQDAVLFLRKSKLKYNFIVVDFPFPYEAELVKLFSVEFYKMLVSHLEPHGMIVMDVPLGCARPDPLARGSGKWKTTLTMGLKEAGFNTVVPYCATDGFLLARLDERDPQTKMQDFGVHYKTVNPSTLPFYIKAGVSMGRGLSENSSLNSVFKPLLPLRSRDF